MFCRKLVVRYRKLTYNDILLIHVHVILLVSVAKNGACVKRNFLMINLMQEELTSRKPDTNWNNCFMWQVHFILMLSNYTFTMFNVYSDISCISLVPLSNRPRSELSYAVYAFTKIKILKKNPRSKTLDGHHNYQTILTFLKISLYRNIEALKSCYFCLLNNCLW